MQNVKNLLKSAIYVSEKLVRKIKKFYISSKSTFYDKNLRRHSFYAIIRKKTLFNIRSKKSFEMNEKQNFRQNKFKICNSFHL